MNRCAMLAVPYLVKYSFIYKNYSIKIYLRSKNTKATTANKNIFKNCFYSITIILKKVVNL